MQKSDKKQNALIIFLRVAAIISAVVLVLLVGVRAGEKLVFAKFYKNAKRELPIPAVNAKFVGQGLDYVDESGVFISCGYSSKKGEASSVYVMKSDGTSYKTALKNQDGSNYTGHTGGVAHYNGFCYITGASGLDVFSLEDILAGGEAVKTGEILSPKDHDPAYVTVHGGKLYEGSFYRAGNYETPQSERITTPNGDENKALIYVYDLSETAPFGVVGTPVAAYSTTGLVQGMTFTETQIVLSTSYGLAASHLLFYDLDKIAAPVKTLVGENETDLSYLDGSCLEKSVKAPPMTEEIVYKDGRIFIMCESASDKYIFGKFMSGRHMYSYKA